MPTASGEAGKSGKAEGRRRATPKRTIRKCREEETNVTRAEFFSGTQKFLASVLALPGKQTLKLLTVQGLSFFLVKKLILLPQVSNKHFLGD